MSSTSSPVQSGATSPSGSQDSESLQIPCEEGWEMSPRSIHWLEIRRLEEKIGRLAHIDEELLKRNKELEQQLKKIKASHSVRILMIIRLCFNASFLCLEKTVI